MTSGERYEGSRVLSGLSTSEKIVPRPTEEGILKKSSAFLANLTHSASRITEKGTHDGSARLRKSCSDVYDVENDVPNRYATLKGYFSILSSATSASQPLRRSPSVHTLPIERKKKSGGRVKKSVSFSSDTSFEEKRAPYKTAAVHEVKVYHQGVLQGTHISVIFPLTTTVRWNRRCRD